MQKKKKIIKQLLRSLIYTILVKVNMNSIVPAKKLKKKKKNRPAASSPPIYLSPPMRYLTSPLAGHNLNPRPLP